MTKPLTPEQARAQIQAATGIPIPRATWYRWLDQGQVPATKIGGRWKLRTDTVHQIIMDAKP